jgi:ribonuclease VapC
VIVDSSAIVGVLLDEPDRARLVERIARAEVVAVAAPTVLEAGMVLSARLGRDAIALLEGFLVAIDAVVIEFGPEHWPVALDAWSRFGRGRHPAALNFGDCIAYAAATVAGLPLLAKGDDFPQTDIQLA